MHDSIEGERGVDCMSRVVAAILHRDETRPSNQRERTAAPPPSVFRNQLIWEVNCNLNDTSRALFCPERSAPFVTSGGWKNDVANS